jgi:hypothetical protein
MIEVSKMSGARLARAFAAAASVAFFAPARAAGETNEIAQVPGDDVFGFTSSADIGNPGDNAVANENDGRVGKRDGRYSAFDQKVEFSHTFSENWWGAASFFTAYGRTRNVTGLPDVDRYRFDGFSFEVAYRLFARSASNPFAVTLSVEPRWGRVDPVVGLISDSYGATFKMFADAVVVPDALYWATNVQATSQTARDPLTPGEWIPSSVLLLSTALSWQASPKIFIGAETRFVTTFDSASLHHPVGRALYLGPTFLWKITDKVVFNTTFQPQIWGRSATNATQRLDLDNFERAHFRAKFVWNF